MTGLSSRAAVLEILGREMARAKREETEASILLADLDHFKNINDTFGHAAGDAVLREAARKMTASGRAYDTAGRYGGEEFLIVLPACDAAAALRVAERIRAAIAADPVSVGGRSIPVTSSLGVASGQAQGADALIRAADAALYRSKRGGRNRVEPATAADFAEGTCHAAPGIPPDPSVSASRP